MTGDGWRECNDKPTRTCIPFNGKKRRGESVIASHQCLGVESKSGVSHKYRLAILAACELVPGVSILLVHAKR